MGEREPAVYGRWIGNERGVPEDPTRCIVGIWPKGRWIDTQCSRKRGHGEDGLYCKQHAKKIEQ